MGANFWGCSNSINNITKEETNTSSSYVNHNNINILKLEQSRKIIEANNPNFKYKNNTNRIIYHEDKYNSLPLTEKICINNKVNKIIKAYKTFSLKKTVSIILVLILIYFSKV